MRVYVPGHRGLVGSAIIRTKPGSHEIVTQDRLDLDITSFTEVKRFFMKEKFDAVIMCAAKVGGIGANSKFQKEFIVENLNIQNAILLAASEAKIENLIFLGSACIYPRISTQPIVESALLSGPLEPSNEGYALAKITGIRLVKAIYEQDGLNFMSLMPTNLYGQNDNFDKFSSHVAAALLRKFHEATVTGASKVVVWGTGTPRREFMHVNDMAEACWFMLDKKAQGQTFNVGTGQDITISEYATLVAKTVGYQGSILFDASKPDGTPRRMLDVTKIHSLGWHHRIELEDGLVETYDWYKYALARGEVRGYR
jgi:GDP-L-fucose synthase